MTYVAILGLDPQWSQIFLVAMALLLALLAFGGWWTLKNRGQSEARLRLDWYLPTIKRLRGAQRIRQSWINAIRPGLPPSWTSDHSTKKRGLLRRYLRSVGISWLASPVRRTCQTVCLLVFLGLFLWTCWPYAARPELDTSVATGLEFREFDQTNGDLQFVAHQLGQTLLVNQRQYYLAITESSKASSASLAAPDRLSIPVTPVLATAEQLVLRPATPLSDTAIDLLLTEQSTAWSLFNRPPGAWPSHYADSLNQREFLPAEWFLAIDPLVSLSTAIASRSWIWSLSCAALILTVCLVIPRGFCGYLCPLGTTIDFFDWLIGKRIQRFRVSGDGWWVHIKYYLLAGTLISSLCGVLISGFFSAIPVITRAALMLLGPLQSGSQRGWHLVPSMNPGQFLSIALFMVVLGLGFLRPRFWCKYVCPSGAVFSIGNLFRITERKVEASCIHCNKCVEICPFDAIKPDFTTRETDCTLCQSCAGVCPTHAIKFVERNNRVELKVLNDPPTQETTIGRRGFLSLASGSTAALVGGVGVAALARASNPLGAAPDALPIRPPGSVPEEQFLQMCIRCGECFKVCPNNVLQVQGFAQGLEGLWTPIVNADWAGCESSCNACGQVCPTGAIRALPIEEKRHARMGLAIVNEGTCLPMAGVEACDLCVKECQAAGYDAIEYQQVGTLIDDNGQPIPDSGFLAPSVIEDRCVGCGICQTRCYAINVKERHLLSGSAIVIKAGEGREDRLLEGSYRKSAPPDGKPAPSIPERLTETEPEGSVGKGAETENSEPEFGENPFGL